MASALLILGNQRVVDRPAIVATMPRTLKGLFVLIDAGANVDRKAENLLLFGLMGSSYCKAIFRQTRAKRWRFWGIGEEDVKGNELTREAFKLLKAQI